MLNVLHAPNTTGQKSIVLSSILHRYSKGYIRSYRKRNQRQVTLQKYQSVFNFEHRYFSKLLIIFNSLYYPFVTFGLMQKSCNTQNLQSNQKNIRNETQQAQASLYKAKCIDGSLLKPINSRPVSKKSYKSVLDTQYMVLHFCQQDG